MKKLFIAFSAVVIVLVSLSAVARALPNSAQAAFPQAGSASLFRQHSDLESTGLKAQAEHKAAGIMLATWQKPLPVKAGSCKSKRSNKSNQRADYQSLCRATRTA